MGKYIAGGVIILVLAIFFIVGFKQGFIKQLFGLIGGIAALVIAYLLCRPVANIFFEHTSWVEKLGGAIADFLHLPDTEVEASNLSAAITAAELPFPQFIIDAIVKFAESMNQSTVQVSIVVSQAIARFIIIVICFILIFILVRILVRIFKKLASGIKHIPLVGFIDSILGMVLGLAKGLLIIYGLLFLINILPFDFLAVVKTAIDESVVAGFLTKYNVVAMLITLIAI